MKAKILILVSIILFLSVCVLPVFAIKPIPCDELGFLVGDVIAVDIKNKEFTVAYLELETNEEKEMTIGVVDDMTIFDGGIYSVASLKVGDVVSVDYFVNASGSPFEFTAAKLCLEKGLPNIEERKKIIEDIS